MAGVVWWNDKERGIRQGRGAGLGIAVHCSACGHSARIRRGVALRLWGERTFTRDIARDLRCSKCGRAAANIQVISEVRPQWSTDASYWGSGPDYPEVDPPEPK